MQHVAGEVAKKALENVGQNMGDGVAGRKGGFDVPGEQPGFGAKDMGKGETGKLGSSFDGPWDKPDRPDSGTEGRFEDRHGVDGRETRPNVEVTQDAGQSRDLGNAVQDYNKEVAQCSAGGDYKEVQGEGLQKRSPQEVAEARSEFNKTRKDMIDKWEETNQRKWPTYDQDVTTAEGKTIRKAGDRYDAHHVQPLELGGKNTAENITPMHAKDHFDKQGIHRPG